MNAKTIAGLKLFFGLVLTVACGRVAAWANTRVGSPADDAYYDMWAWGGTIGAIAGLALFFFGAKGFAQRSGPS